MLINKLKKWLKEISGRDHSENSLIPKIAADEVETEEKPKNQGEFVKRVSKEITEKYGQEFWISF